MQGDAAFDLAEVMYLTGDRTRAAEMTQHAIECYQGNGMTARVARAQRLTAAWASGGSPASGAKGGKAAARKK
jgi:hypothetical protein